MQPIIDINFVGGMTWDFPVYGLTSKVSATSPPMMDTAIGPQNTWRVSGIIASMATEAGNEELSPATQVLICKGTSKVG
jgi:hypothetical protein